MKEKLAKMEALQRDNLFANGDFRFGAINQKSKTTYNTIYGYGIDLWCMISTGTQTVNANSISVNCDLKYFFEKQLPNGDYTFAISVAGTVYKYTFKGFSGPSKRTNLTVAGKTLGIELINNMFILYANGVTHTIQFIKLEPGTEYTGMTVWNESEELLKCQSNQYKVSGINIFFGTTGPRVSRVLMYIPLPTKMIKKPSINGNYVIKFRNYTNQEYWSVATGSEIVAQYDGQIVIALTIDGIQRNIVGECYLEGELLLDANNY